MKIKLKIKIKSKMHVHSDKESSLEILETEEKSDTIAQTRFPDHMFMPFIPQRY